MKSFTLQRISGGLLLSLMLGKLMAAPAPTLDELIRNQPTSAESASSINAMRYEALRTTALSIGTQAGLAFGYSANRARLEKMSLFMDKTFPFQAMMMEGNVVPPVITEVVEVFDQQSLSQLRLADRERTILSPPRFSYAAPNWRDYFSHDFAYEASAISNVVAKTSEEQALWKSALTEGYQLGIEQAAKIFDNDTARMARDLNGMRLYHQLLSAGKVTKPFVSVVHMGVTGDKNSTMKEGESFLQISATPEFVMNPNQWNVALPSSIQERLKVLADPVQGAKLVEKLGVSKESRAFPGASRAN